MFWYLQLLFFPPRASGTCTLPEYIPILYLLFHDYNSITWPAADFNGLPYVGIFCDTFPSSISISRLLFVHGFILRLNIEVLEYNCYTRKMKPYHVDGTISLLVFWEISRLNQIGLNPALLRQRFCSSFPNSSFIFFSNFLLIVGHSNCKILTPLGILQHEWLKLSSSARQLVPKAVSVIAKKR